MIKKIIHLNFHIKYSHLLDNTNYLYGSIFEMYNETDSFAQYKEDSYIFKLSKEFTIEKQIYVSNRTWVDLVYYKDNHFIFEYQDDEYQYFQTLDRKKVSIPLNDKKNYIFLLDKLFVFNPNDKNNRNTLVFNSSLDKIIDCNISHQEVVEHFREKENMQLFEKIASCLADYSVLQYIKIADEYIVVSFEEQHRYIIFRLNLNFDILERKVIFSDEKYIFSNMYPFKDFYYFIFSKNDINYIVKKCDKNFNILDEEKIKTYRCEIISINNNVCLIVDDPKRYEKNQKQYKNQELMGKSSLLILD